MLQIILFILLHLGCTGNSKSPQDGQLLGGDGGSDGDGGATAGPDGRDHVCGPTYAGVPFGRVPIPRYDCPPPPDDAIVFHMGTLQGDQVFYIGDDGRDGWHMALSGISYVRDEACADLFVDSVMGSEIKAGDRPGEYTAELIVSLPGTGVDDWLGEFPANYGYLWSDMPAHQAKIGWNDGSGYQWVVTLPNGWTKSTVCVGAVSPDYVYLTFLWDPIDGPFTTNEHTQVHQPIWFDAEMWSYNRDPKYGKQAQCTSTQYAGVEQDDIFGHYSWPAQWGPATE
ncbi:MAG: hypothetical protein GXP62_06960 [Oligoflexia bacterium]|nr:hypothetical protein [Oligoflexia bacterium]